jgi:hypothetical protein
MEKQTRRFSWSVAVPRAWVLGPWWYLECVLGRADRVTFWQPERAKVRDKREPGRGHRRWKATDEGLTALALQWSGGPFVALNC